MTDQNALKQKRVRAYTDTKYLFEGLGWADADLTKDENLAVALDVNLSDLTSLREGKVNPSPKLVEAVKLFFDHDPSLVAEIDHFLGDLFNTE